MSPKAAKVDFAVPAGGRFPIISCMAPVELKVISPPAEMPVLPLVFIDKEPDLKI